METTMPMTTTSTYSSHCLPADVPLPVEADGTIRIWFAMRELRFASVAEPTLFAVKYEGAESVSRAKITTFLDNYKTVVVLATNPMEAFEAFALQMEWVEAAGGVVESERGEVVMIRRNSRWDLPKLTTEQDAAERLPTPLGPEDILFSSSLNMGWNLLLPQILKDSLLS